MALSMGALVALGLSILLVTHWLWPLYVNYRIGKKSGFPIFVSPFNPDNVSRLPQIRRAGIRTENEEEEQKTF